MLWSRLRRRRKLQGLLEKLVLSFEQGDERLALAQANELLSEEFDDQETSYIAAVGFGIRGETHRGAERFDLAATDYQMAIDVGRSMQDEHRSNEYFIAWYPRAWLGLIIALRRLFLTKPDDLLGIIGKLRTEPNIQRTRDFVAQTDAVEGSIHRQAGRTRQARDALERACSELDDMRLHWYLFWEPLQVEAHLILTLFVDRDTPFGEAVDLAERHLQRAGVGHWSRDAALTVILQAATADLLSDGADPAEADERFQLESRVGAPERLLAWLGTSAGAKDPTWTTEWLMLRAVWAAARDDLKSSAAALASLQSFEMGPTLTLLRGLEVSLLQDSHGLLSEPHTGGAVRHRALEILERRRPSLEEFGLSAFEINWARRVLNMDAPTVGLEAWGSDELQRFRGALWP